MRLGRVWEKMKPPSRTATFLMRGREREEAPPQALSSSKEENQGCVGLDCRWPAQVLVPVLSAGGSWRRRASHVRGCPPASTLLVVAAQVSLLLRQAPKGIARMLMPAMISAVPPHADGTEQRHGAGAAVHVALQVSVHPATRKMEPTF